ncbi:MAG: hypothetical protein IJ461_07410 [Clostridia bacterium]|nr:hypothetical protein [Clostridia bacterium]
MLIQSPPNLQGNERRQLVQLHSYLYQMAQALNASLNDLTVESFRPEAQALFKSAATQREVAQNAQALKAMIIKTAREVTARMDEITATLEGDYLAKSEFGEYRQALSNEITATAQGVVQSYGYDSRLDALDETMAGFLSYETATKQYIKTGLLFYDEEGVPRYGVAVGESETEITGDGETLVSRSGLLATFTSDRLSFWQNGVETAWVSNGQWCTRALEVQERIDLGPWQIAHTSGFTVKWMG